MAYTKIIVIHHSLKKCLDYALNRDKTESSCFETAVNCELGRAYPDMLDTKRRWGKEGRLRQGYHIIQSFAPGEVTPEVANAVGVVFAQRLLGDRYEVVVTTHLNKAHLHNHIVFNSVSFLDGIMYRDQLKDYYGGDGVGIRGTSDAICQAYGLSVIEPCETWKDGFSSRAEWEAKQSGKPTVRELVRRDIDAAITESYTMKSFWKQLTQMGYTIKRGSNIKHTTVRPDWSKGNIRLDGLGAGYTEADIQARLADIRSGETPPPTQPAPPPPSQWLNPGQRYRAHGSLHGLPRKLHGFRALYFKYLYLLGAIPQRRPKNRAAFLLREELIKFDRYQEQFRYLMKNRIDTANQLAMQYDALQAEIDALTDRRAELYRLRRSGRGGETTGEEITTITTHLRGLRRELKLCVRIEGDIPRIREGMVAQPPDHKRSKTHEKANQGRPNRNPGADPGLPAGDARAH